MVRVIGFALSLLALSGQDVPRAAVNPRAATPLDQASMRDYPPRRDSEPGEEQRGFTFDLNRDGSPEIIRAYGPKTCGTGGCPIEIFDGRTRAPIADLFGDPLWVLGTAINGWPVLGVYSHGSATSGSYETLVFDGKHYVTASTVMLYGRAVEELFAKYKAAPKVK